MVFLFFSSTEPRVVLILFLYFCLSYNICQNFVHQLLKLHTPHLVDKLSCDIYLLITVHLCFLKSDKKFFVLMSALIVLISFLFSRKSHCSFKIVLIKKKSVLSFFRYILSIFARFFLVPSFELYLLDYFR